MKIIKNKYFKALIAGMLVGLTGVEFIMVRTINGELGQFLASLFFPFGNTLICLLVLYLFNGKIALVVTKERFSFLTYLFMFIINVTGVCLIGIIYLLISKINSPIFINAREISSLKFPNYSFTHIVLRFVKAFSCGVFVCLGNFLFRTFKKIPLKIIGIWVCIFIYVFLGYNNGMTDFFYMIAGEKVSLLSILYCFIGLFGNVCGALSMQIMINEIGSAINNKRLDG